MQKPKETKLISADETEMHMKFDRKTWRSLLGKT
jgi:hypothetical protein